MSGYRFDQAGTDMPGYDFSPTVMIYGDTPMGIAAAQQSAETLGARIGCAEPLDQAVRQSAADAILIDVAGHPGDQFDDVLDQIEYLATRQNIPSAISMPIELVDRVAARITHPAITLLCSPTPLDRAAALGVALAEKRVYVADANTELESIRLRRLADEVGRIAKALSNLSSTNSAQSPLQGSVSDMISSFRAEPMFDEPTPDGMSASDLRNVIRVRRMRERFFDSQLFADPAWDMLLDLMAAQLERVQVAVSSLCIAAAVPPTTALRWIKTMTDAGIFERIADPDDGRRIFIRLSDNATNAMQRYFAAATAIQARAI
jgi:hypothetical protein